MAGAMSVVEAVVVNIQGPRTYTMGDTRSDKVLKKRFKKLCNKRHLKRSDVKKNEYALLKIKEWQELMAKITAQMPKASKSERRRL